MIKLTDTQSVLWKSQTISLRDQGFQLTSDFDFTNPSVASISNVTGIDSYISLFGSNFLHYGVQNLSLVQGSQQASWIFNLDLIDELIDPANSVKALEKFVQAISETGSMGLHGPFRLHNSIFLEKATPNLNISIADLIVDTKAAPNSDSGIMKSILDVETIAKMLKDSKISASLKGKTVVVDLDLVIPLSLAIPSITLPFDTSFILGDSKARKLSTVKITKPILQRKESSINLVLAVEVTPETSLRSVTALTKMLAQYITTKSAQISISGLDLITEKEHAFVTRVLKPAVFKFNLEAGVLSDVMKKIVQGIVEKLPLIKELV